VTEGRDTSLHVGLPVGGRQVVLILDGRPGYYHGLNLVDGKRAYENGTTSKGRLFRPGEWLSIECVVEPDHIVASVDGRRIVGWIGSFERLSLMDRHTVPRKDVLFLGSVDSRYEFKNIVVSRN
jgi:hypothetical protein